MNVSDDKPFRGVAGLFSRAEIKKYFLVYLISIFALEIFVLLVSFLGNLSPDKGPFPWEAYCLAAFLIPVVITFFLGIFVYAFNKYLFQKSEVGESTTSSAGLEEPDTPSNSHLVKFQSVLQSMRQLPFLFILLALGVGAIFLFKLDTIAYQLGRLGGSAAKYIIIFFLIVLALAVIIALVWLYINYSLRKKNMQYHHEYKRQVMEQVGLIMLDDNTVIDNTGKIVNQGGANIARIDHLSAKDVTLLPSPDKSAKKN